MNVKPTSGPMHARDMTRILDALRKIVQVLRTGAQRNESRFGMSPAQLFALQKLSRSQPMSVNELSAQTFTHQSSVSVVVRRLVDRGLVQRTPSPDDARQVHLTLTAAGERLRKRLPRAPQDRLVRGIKNLAPTRRKQLGASLEALLQAMHVSTTSPARMLFEDPEPRRRTARRRRGS